MMMKLEDFISKSQVYALKDLLAGEEKNYFAKMLMDLSRLIENMPMTYETEVQQNPLVYLHYFNADSDWWIVEKDIEEKQLQAFGYVSLHGWEIEAGYINIVELLENNIEMDLYWTPKPVKNVLACYEDAKKEAMNDQMMCWVGDTLKARYP
jgi:hypothetical protein